MNELGEGKGSFRPALVSRQGQVRGEVAQLLYSLYTPITPVAHELRAHCVYSGPLLYFLPQLRNMLPQPFTVGCKS